MPEVRDDPGLQKRETSYLPLERPVTSVRPQGAAAEGFGKVWTLATTPSQALEAFRAKTPDSVSAVLVTPGGKAMLSYPAGFDPARLRLDLKKAVQVAL